MYVTRATWRPRCTEWKSLLPFGFRPSSSPHRGSPTVVRRMRSGTSWIPTPAHALLHLSSIPLHVDGTACSLITPAGSLPQRGSYRSRSARSFPVLHFDVATGPADRPADRFVRSAWLPQFPVPLACTPAESRGFRTARSSRNSVVAIQNRGRWTEGASRGLRAEFIKATASDAFTRERSMSTNANLIHGIADTLIEADGQNVTA